MINYSNRALNAYNRNVREATDKPDDVVKKTRRQVYDAVNKTDDVERLKEALTVLQVKK